MLRDEKLVMLRELAEAGGRLSESDLGVDDLTILASMEGDGLVRSS
jgi:hypothetical protein